MPNGNNMNLSSQNRRVPIMKGEIFAQTHNCLFFSECETQKNIENIVVRIVLELKKRHEPVSQPLGTEESICVIG